MVGWATGSAGNAMFRNRLLKARSVGVLSSTSKKWKPVGWWHPKGNTRWKEEETHRKTCKDRSWDEVIFDKTSSGEKDVVRERVCVLCQDTRHTNIVIIVHKQSVNGNRSKLVLHPPSDKIKEGLRDKKEKKLSASTDIAWGALKTTVEKIMSKPHGKSYCESGPSPPDLYQSLRASQSSSSDDVVQRSCSGP